MNRRLFVLVFVLLFGLSANAKIYIPLVKSVPPSTSSGGEARVGERTSSHAPMAFFEEDTLYLQFPIPTATSVIITIDSTDLAILSQTCVSETTHITLPIGSLSLYEQYNLSVNAYGIWWVGYFEYIPSSPALSVQKYISVKVDDPNSERNYGVYSVAGNSTSGWNFGVSGILSDQKNGTGIYGSSSYDEGFNAYGRYAGLFHGDLKTTDVVYASAYNTLADSRLNKDMEQILNGSLDKLMQISVYKYNLEQLSLDNGNGSLINYFNNESELLDKMHYGLSGQEIKDIYPSLVSQSQDGYLSVNYTEMIPILIQSIQELKKELDDTKAELNSLKSTSNVASRTATQESLLEQNVPNPFREKCIIKCYIPHYANTAFLRLYDLNGHQIQSRSLTERGNVQVVIEGTGLAEGTYLYSLFLDGELIDTRRMIHIE